MLKAWKFGTRVDCTTRVGQWTGRRPFAAVLQWSHLELYLEYVPRFGYWCKQVRPRGWADQANLQSRFPEKERPMQRRKVRGLDSIEGLVETVVVSKVFAKLPALVAHCSTIRYEDGTPRTPGWWTFRRRGQLWEVILKDPDSASSLTATGDCPDDALALADKLLQSVDTAWEPDQYLQQAQKRTAKRK